VNTFGELLAEIPTEVPTEVPTNAKPPRVTPIREHFQRTGVSPVASLRDEQIQGLVQQLFFRRGLGPVRHVGFSSVEASTGTATLCLDVARALAAEDRYDVGLIDAHSDTVRLQNHLQILSSNSAEPNWPIAPRLWMVPRQNWLPDACGQRTTDQNLSRLRELTTEFDFSILWCAPASWLAASIGQACDGLVLVLTANKTRRLVAAQIKDQLSKAKVPLLGTVLAERRFPVPQGLYRSL
jgi:Mrp family chromosome partitioning ATPase